MPDIISRTYGFCLRAGRMTIELKTGLVCDQGLKRALRSMRGTFETSQSTARDRKRNRRAALRTRRSQPLGVPRKVTLGPPMSRSRSHYWTRPRRWPLLTLTHSAVDSALMLAPPDSRSSRGEMQRFFDIHAQPRMSDRCRRSCAHRS
jgi:hypothetical protein